jgi:bifunctional ADP-heptose synthase (sugar kinase/adenylyltransferase)
MSAGLQVYQAELSQAAAAAEAADTVGAGNTPAPDTATAAAGEADGQGAAAAVDAAAAAAAAGGVVVKPHSSSYRGVSWHERSRRWEVSSRDLVIFYGTLFCAVQ